LELSSGEISFVRSVTRTIQVPNTGSRNGTRGAGSAISGVWYTFLSVINAGWFPGQVIGDPLAIVGYVITDLRPAPESPVEDVS